MPPTLSTLLLPELHSELKKTRRVLERVPDGHNDFRSAEKSMPLSRLAGHTAEMAGFVAVFLTHATVNMGTPSDPRKILRMETQGALLTSFEELAANALTTLEAATDDDLLSPFTLTRQGGSADLLRHTLRRLPEPRARSHDPPPRPARRLPSPAQRAPFPPPLAPPPTKSDGGDDVWVRLRVEQEIQGVGRPVPVHACSATRAGDAKGGFP